MARLWPWRLLCALVALAACGFDGARAQIKAKHLATAINSFNGQTSVSRSIDFTKRGARAFGAGYAKLNFGAIPGFSTTKSGCFLTGQLNGGNGDILPVFMAPMEAAPAVCARSGLCTYYIPFNGASGCYLDTSSTATVNGPSTAYCGSINVQYYNSPKFGYIAPENPCPYGWNGETGSPWKHIGTPVIQGTCASHTYSCPEGTGALLFGTDDNILPYLTFWLPDPKQADSQRNMRCIMGFFTFKLTRRSDGEGCAYNQYKFTLEGVDANAWQSFSLTYENKPAALPGQSVDLLAMQYSGTGAPTFSYDTRTDPDPAQQNAVFDMINKNVAYHHGDYLSFRLRLTCSDPNAGTSYMYVYGGTSGDNAPDVFADQVFCDPDEHARCSHTIHGCECESANYYLIPPAEVGHRYRCARITCTYETADIERHITYPGSGTMNAGEPVTGSCEANYYAAAPPQLQCTGQTSTPYISQSTTGTLVHPAACEPCSACSEGNQCADGACTTCPVDTFSASPGAPECTACGSTATTNGQDGQATCSCKAGGSATATGGYYGNGASGHSLVCTQCPDGSYQPAFSGVSTKQACDCIQNYYSADGAATVASPCKPCPAHSKTLDANGNLAVRATTCTCDSGGSATVPGGAYSNGESGDALECQLCPAFSYQPEAGGTSCVCVAGYSSNGEAGAALECTACPIAHYKEAAAHDHTVCQACPWGYDTSADGTGEGGEAAASASACVPCAVGYYQEEPGTPCKPAPPNTYTATAGTGNTAVLECPAGTSTEGASGRSQRSQCAACPPGESSVAGGDCARCPANTYAENGDEPGSARCVFCPAGFDTDGLDGQTECERRCDVNTYAPGNGTACTPCPAGRHTNGQQGQATCLDCPAGTFSVDGGDCEACAADQFAPKGSPQCYNCTDGSVPAVNREYCLCKDGYASNGGIGETLECTKCAPGEFAPGGRLEATACTPCPVNTYCPDGAAVPKTCPANSRADEGWALCVCRPGYNATVAGTNLTCTLCPAGTANPGEANTACAPCPAGMDSAPGASKCHCAAGYGPDEGDSCRQCAPGTYSPIGAECTQCPANRYCPEAGQTVSLPCPNNTVSAPGSASCTCRAGYYNETGNVFADTDCLPCPANTYSGVGATACLACPANANSTAGSEVCTCTPGSEVQGGNCTLCAPGTYSDAGEECQQCPANQFSATAGATGCQPCAPEATSAPGAIACTCIAGYAQSAADGSACAVCPQGTYNDVPGAAECQTCPDGADSAAGATTCRCKDGYASSGTAATLNCTRCPDGWVAASGASTCTQCPAGYFSDPSQPAATCTVCPAGSTSAAGATACTCRDGYATTGTGASLACTPCQPGSFAASGDAVCTGCPAGSYQPEPVRSSCTPCPAGYYSTATNATSFAKCAACPAGTYQPSAGQTGCIACGAGTYSTGVAQTSPATCKPCPAGQYQGDEGQAECLTCPANHYSGTGASGCEPCLQHSSSVGGAAFCACDEGYFSPTGGSTTTACTACPPNSTSVAGSIRCACSRGHYSADGLATAAGCAPCPINTYSEIDGTGSTRCVDCPAGYATNGTAAQSSAWACVACERGSYRASNMEHCTLCAPNTFSSAAGSSSCTSCPAGTTTAGAAGSTSSLACLKCPPGTASSGQGADCAACPVNTFANKGALAGSTSCEPCPPNTDTRGATSSTACTPCVAGRATTGPQTACAACPAGQFSVAGGNCTACPANTYSSGGMGECTPCPAGTDTAGATGQTSAAACKPCAVGYYSPGNAAACEPCPVNTYANGTAPGGGTGSSSCLVCANGTSTGGHVGQDSADDCTPCAAGTFSALGSNCTACPAGTYASGGSRCVPCPFGTYSAAVGASSASTCEACPAFANTTSTGATSSAMCRCLKGYVGAITGGPSDKCTACTSACDAHAVCPGGATCGGCQAGYVGSGAPGTCKVSLTKVATVSTGQPTATCPGIAIAKAAACSACNNLGAGAALLSGGSPTACVAAANSPCCNLPVFAMDYVNTTAVRYPLLEFRAVPTGDAALARRCLQALRLTIHVSNGTFACSGALVHTVEVLPPTWDPATVTWATTPAPVDTMVLNGTGYSVGIGSARYLDITAPEHLDVLNRNLQAYDGVLSVAIKRTCSTGAGPQSTLYYGLAFDGSRTPAGADAATFGPVPTPQLATCHADAVCTGGRCQCAPGYVGNGVTECAPCHSKCADNIMCLGGEACGTTCVPGYAYNGTACVPSVSKIATVRQSRPAAPCVGTQSYANSTAALACGDCTAGPSDSAQLCGTSLGVGSTACCHDPVYHLAARANAAPTPGPATVTAYAFMAFDAVPPAEAGAVCLSHLQLSAPDQAPPPCETSYFQLGFVDDADWTEDVTWDQVAALQAAGRLAATTVQFVAADLGGFDPTAAALDVMSANLRKNGGRLSFFVKRWCNATALNMTNVGHDDNYRRGASVRLASVDYVTCDPNAECHSATCVCKTNYYGNGKQCQPVTCSGPSAPGFAFDENEVVPAGSVQTAPCAAGETGLQWRRCMPTGGSPVGNFDAPTHNCTAITCPAENAYNATFSGATRDGETSGTCLPGFAGTISRRCTVTDGVAAWSAPVGECIQIVCPFDADMGHASWPETPARDTAFDVEGICHTGYRTESSGRPRRACLPTGLYSNEITNACERIVCGAVDDYDHASWPKTIGGQPAAGACAAGYRGTPRRTCGANGTWEESVTNPCQPIQCPETTTGGGGTVFAAAAPGLATGTCAPAYEPVAVDQLPRQTCLADGTWANDVASACVRKVCKGDDVSDEATTWDDAPAGSPATVVTGTCNAGYYARFGPPYRGCDADGVWQPLQNPCDRVVCAATTSANATWPATFAGDTAAGVCAPGFYGSPTRTCTASAGDAVGTWGAVVGSCTQAFCAADTLDGAAFPESAAGTTADGTCTAEGMYGKPRRECILSGESGVWSETVINPCAAELCPALEDDGHAAWPSAAETEVKPGICNEAAGWFGNPQRECGPEGWMPIANPCVRRGCAAGTTSHAVFAAAFVYDVVNGTCAEGYGTEDGRPPQSTCEVSGEFTEPAPPCVQLECAGEETDDGLVWPTTTAGETVTVGCPAGFEGSRTRRCAEGGQWLVPSGTCTRRYCEQQVETTAIWPVTPAGTATVTGQCRTGYATANNQPPTRPCDTDGRFGTVANPCVQLVCPAVTIGNAQFPPKPAGEVAVGKCLDGYSALASPQMQCLPSGAWSFTVINPCVRRQCPGGNTDGNARWPDNAVAGQTVAGQLCKPGYTGFVSRTCTTSGKWSSAITGSCTRVACPARADDGNAAWPETPAPDGSSGLQVKGTCAAGYVGSPVRLCQPDGTWDAISVPCQLATCPGETAGNAVWLETVISLSTTGICNANMVGAPRRTCLQDPETHAPTWGPVEGDACVVPPAPCEATATACGDGGASTWPQTPAGTVTEGTCCPLYLPAPGTSGPTRRCTSSGFWSASITSDCVLALNNGSGGRVTDLSATNILTAAQPTVRLAWQTTSRDADRFQIYAARSGGRLEKVSLGVGVDFLTDTSFTVTGLAESAEYVFFVVAGDGVTWDIEGASVNVTTVIAAPAVASDAVQHNDTAVTLVWQAGSPSTAYYSIDGIILGGGKRRRELELNNHNYTEVMPLKAKSADGTAETFTVTGLVPGTAYRFRIWAYDAAKAPLSYIDYAFTTLVQQGSSNNTPSVTVGAPYEIVGGVAAAVVVLFVAIGVAFYIYRRRSLDEQRKLLEEYSAQLQTLTLSRAGVLPSSMAFAMSDADELRANLIVPRTSFSGVDATLINTVMEVALPGFLLMDYSTDLRPESRVASGGAGTIFRGTLLQQDAIQRNGGEVCAIKEVTSWPTLSEEDNLERFHQEVSIMWSLTFHPNVIKLIGYTQNPNTIVTRLYPTDLFRYLHTQEDKETLEPHLILHLCSGMVAAVAAVHSMGIAHRDVKSPNFLLQEPKAGSPFPNPILCDFGLSRTADDSSKFDSIKGISPRYAAPEVFARVHLRTASNTVDDDKQSDMYALGVVMWETMTRHIPWDGVSNEDIEVHVRSGARVPHLEVDPNETILVTLNGLIDAMLDASPERRPAAPACNSKLASFIRSLIA